MVQDCRAVMEVNIACIRKLQVIQAWAPDKSCMEPYALVQLLQMLVTIHGRILTLMWGMSVPKPLKHDVYELDPPQQCNKHAENPFFSSNNTCKPHRCSRGVLSEYRGHVLQVYEDYDRLSSC